MPRSPSCSSNHPYKLKQDLPSQPNSETLAVSHPEDLYSIPRSLLAPSPSNRPHPFSRTTSNSTPYPQSITSSEYQSDYDIPHSIILDHHHGSVNSLLDSAKSPSATSGCMLQGKSSSSSSLPSSEPVSQADYLRDEYPDYDVPKVPKEYLDYDVPKPHPRAVTPKTLHSLLKTENGEIVRNAVSTPDISFGDLDSIMAEINLQVLEAQQLSAQHTFLDEKSSLEIQQSLLARQLEQHMQVEQKAKQQEEERLQEERKHLLQLQQEQAQQEHERQLLEDRQRLERHKQQLKQQQISLDDIIAVTRESTAPPKAIHTRAFSEDNCTPSLHRQENDSVSAKKHNATSSYDRLPPGMIAKILSDQDVRTFEEETLPECVSCQIPEPPCHLADLGKQFKVDL